MIQSGMGVGGGRGCCACVVSSVMLEVAEHFMLSRTRTPAFADEVMARGCDGEHETRAGKQKSLHECSDEPVFSLPYIFFILPFTSGLVQHLGLGSRVSCSVCPRKAYTYIMIGRENVVQVGVRRLISSPRAEHMWCAATRWYLSLSHEDLWSRWLGSVAVSL